MTPTSIGGEQQAGISGGSESPSCYSLRQDCRGAQEKYVMQLHDAHLAGENAEAFLRRDCRFLGTAWNGSPFLCVAGNYSVMFAIG